MALSLPPVYVDTGLDEFQKYALLGALLTVVAIPYLRIVCSKVAPGWGRFLLFVPVMVFCCSTTVLFNPEDELLARIVAVFIWGWLGSFKVMGLSFGRGPLLGSWSYVQFSIILLLPVYCCPIRHAEKGAKAQAAKMQASGRDVRTGHDVLTPQMVLRVVSKVALLAFVVMLLIQVDLNRMIKYWAYAFGLYAFLGVMMDGLGMLGTSLLDMELVDPFDCPWLSASTAEFWRQRWNVTTGYVLRTVVYDVITDGSFVLPAGPSKSVPSLFRRASAMCTTFFVSGFVHDIILWAIQPDGRISLRFGLFFHVQGPLMLLEMWARRRAGTWQLRHPVYVILTLAVQFTLAYYTFFHATDVDTNTALRVANALSARVE